MKILIVTPRIPYPPYRGDKLKIFNLIKYLSKNHAVSLLTFYENETQLHGDFREIEKITHSAFAIRRTLAESVLSVGKGIFSKLPFQVLFYQSEAFGEKLREITRDNSYDVIYFHLIRTTQYLKYVSGTSAVRVQDFTDAVSMYLSRYLMAEKNPVKKFGIGEEAKRIESYEKEARSFDAIYVCSEKDRDYLSGRYDGKKISLLMNGVNLETFSPIDIPYEPNRIIFTGNMPYFANSDAAVYFVREIFPLVLKEIPDARFYIVGQKPPQAVKDLASQNVIVTGFVEDIRAEYCKSAVNIAPIRFGAGTLNKVIESLALGIPVVSTSMAVSGLPAEIKSRIPAGDTPEEFAKLVVDVLRNREKYAGESKQLSAVIREKLSWDTILSGFEQELELLASRKRLSLSGAREQAM
ncbi:MAG: hypothetical protein FMNOHCHN_02211 [Ignavibacteriaceae bacterium]|nr:hypothetical protein [Ignavibacteriaceae bacterium]